MAKKILRKTKQFSLPVIIEPCVEGGYFARCPTFPGCHVEGETVAEVVEFIEDAIKTFIASYKNHGDNLPYEVAQYELKDKYSQLRFFIPVQVVL